MRKFGLIGQTLDYSFSKNYFGKKFQDSGIDALYENYEFEDPDKLEEWLKKVDGISGLNVTIPYKEHIIRMLDKVTIAAKLIGAVNTIKFNEDGSTSGHNTDVIGFRETLEPLLSEHHSSAMILGTGGASKAVQFVLEQLEIPFQLVSREAGSRQITYEALSPEIIYQHKIIVNTTPLGTFPDVDEMPDLPYEGLSEDHLLYDLIYNPEETMFLSIGKELGAQTKNGYEMLERQAEASWQIWNEEVAGNK